MKKWIAKRFLLKSDVYFYNALVYGAGPFLNEILDNYKDTNWYCSRKAENDGSKPSIRIYLNINEDDKSEILSRLDTILKKQPDLIGWNGQYDDPDPNVPDKNKSNLSQLQNACEIALSLMKNHSCVKNKEITDEFLEEITNQLRSFYKSMLDNSLSREDIGEALHFVANNLGLEDSSVYYLAASK